MKLLVIVLLIVCIGVPLAYAWRIGRLDEPSRLGWLLITADAVVFMALVLLLGRWDIAGYYTRFVLVAVFILAVLLSWRRHAARPWRASGSPSWRSHLPTLVSLLAFSAALAYVLSGLFPGEEPRALTFPLNDGHFMVGQGGGITLLNHHADHAEQRYAADITAIDDAGFRASGILPAELDRYVIYGATVVSPCDGTVTDARDGLPDLVPPKTDRENPKGNNVIVSCDNIHVVLAHLQQGSVAVTAGDTIKAGDVIARVGNSGSTTEPHLHIHAVNPATRIGVPMSFDGRAPIRNRLFES